MNPVPQAATPDSATVRLPKRAPSRVVIEGVEPEVDEGRFPIKRTVGEDVEVRADVFADGHDLLSAVLRFRYVGTPAADADWTEVPMTLLGNDRWSARFHTTALGQYEYTLQAWIDRFATWRKELVKKSEAGQDVASELLEGSELVAQAARRAPAAEGEWLRVQAAALGRKTDQAVRIQTALDTALVELMAHFADRSLGTTYEHVLRVTVEQERARYGAWYEMFPRSCADEPGRHGTFRDCEKRLPYVAEMGFDVLYLPPIHPIGRSFRKGPNNTLNAGPDDPGSPWAIGGAEGGHKAIHPHLGTLADFDRLVAAARDMGIEIALDIAFQCSPDHPYVREHPEWFRHRPDGTIKYAENPPKKYQDIYPLDFECADWQGLWDELLSVFLFWVDRGVRIFRVDNPHTKPFGFWEWVIGRGQRALPRRDLSFRGVHAAQGDAPPGQGRLLAVVHLLHLAEHQAGDHRLFHRADADGRAREHAAEPVRQHAGHPAGVSVAAGPGAFRLRLVLAATLGATYGIYGPPFENCDRRRWARARSTSTPRSTRCVTGTGSGRALPRVHRPDQPNPPREPGAALRPQPAVLPHRQRRSLFYSKTTPDLSNIILVVVNLDPHHTQSGWVGVPLSRAGPGPERRRTRSTT